MSHALTIEVPDPIYRSLADLAAREGTTPEDLAREWVAHHVRELGDDPLLQWAGAIESDAADVAERHDDYSSRPGSSAWSSEPGTWSADVLARIAIPATVEREEGRP